MLYVAKAVRAPSGGRRIILMEYDDQTMSIEYLMLVLLLGTANASLSFQPFDPSVPCSDGSPAGIYVEESSSPDDQWGSRDHVIVFSGGGGCTSPENCEEDYAKEPFKFSSAFNPTTIEGSTILSHDPSVNPMHSYQKWLVPYCSQDFFLGDINKGSVGSFVHAGSLIFDEALEYWRDQVLLHANVSQADVIETSFLENVVVVGISSGSIAVMNKVEAIQNVIGRTGGAKNLRILLDSPSVMSDREYDKKDFREAMVTYVDLNEHPLCNPLHPYSRRYVVGSALPCCLSTHCMLRHDVGLSRFLLPESSHSSNISLSEREELLILDSAYDTFSILGGTSFAENSQDEEHDDEDELTHEDTNSLWYIVEYAGNRKTRAMATLALTKASAGLLGETSIEQSRVMWVFTSCVTHTFLVPSVDLLHLSCRYGYYDDEDYDVVCSHNGLAVEFHVDFLSLTGRIWKDIE